MRAQLLALLAAAVVAGGPVNLQWTMPSTASRACAVSTDTLPRFTAMQWQVAVSFQSPSYAAKGSVWGMANWPTVAAEAAPAVIAEGFAGPGERVRVVAPGIARSPRTYWVRARLLGSHWPCWSRGVTVP